VEIDDVIGRQMPSLRIPSGLIVAASTSIGGGGASIRGGDVIQCRHGTAVRSVMTSCAALRAAKPRTTIVLQVELFSFSFRGGVFRALFFGDGKLTFIAFELD